MTRLYIDSPLKSGDEVILPTATAHHVRAVLRLTADAEITLFNGRGAVHAGRLICVRRDQVAALVGSALDGDSESPLKITLVQSISRGERMDFTIQKAVELGIERIVPVTSLRTVVQLDQKREAKRVNHWRGIIQHAAEQSGRTCLPQLVPVVPLATWINTAPPSPCYVLHPATATPLTRQPPPGLAATLVAGPEGGFDPREITMLEAAGARTVALGPRILRTETAAVCALAVMQALWGDLA